jgi:hypothetical protein
MPTALNRESPRYANVARWCAIVTLLSTFAAAGATCSAADDGANAAVEAGADTSADAGANAGAELPGQSFFLFGPAVAELGDPHPRAMGFVEYRYEPAPVRAGPWLALEATARDVFVGFGGFVDVPLGAGWLFSASLGAAIYRDYNGLRLGSPLEFRITGEFTRQVKHGRIGAGFTHFSNARTGESNPGTEIVKIIWVMPLKHIRPD